MSASKEANSAMAVLCAPRNNRLSDLVRLTGLLLLLVLVPWMHGCGTIYSVEPFGNEIAVFDPNRIDGLWLAGDGRLIGVRVVDAENGVVTTWLAKNRPDSEKPIALRCDPPIVSNLICSSESALGTCMVDKKESTCADRAVATCSWRHYKPSFYFPVVADAEKQAYATTFALVIINSVKSEKRWPLAVLMYAERSSPTTIAGPGRPSRLERLIDEGRLPGRKDERGARILGPLSPEDYELIFSPPNPGWGPFKLFPSPYVFTKLPDDIDPCKRGGARK